MNHQQEPLQGLESLHRDGYMHRDVSLKNLLVMSENPPQAVLCDYGKAVKAEKATQTNIGPIPFLAPEVGEKAGYTNKIDIWGVGIVGCFILFPKAVNDLIVEGERPNIKWYSMMLTMLSTYKEKGTQEKNFANLIEGMLGWRWQTRLSVSVSLNLSRTRFL